MSLPNIEKSIMPWIGKTGKMMTAFAIEKFKQYNMNLTIEQWLTLKMLNEEDGRIQNDMALITNRNKTSLTRLINTMEKNNLVVRIPDKEDKRVNRVYVTKTGKNIFKQTMPIMQECMNDLQTGLTAKEIKSLVSILKKVQKNIQNIVAPQTKKK